MQQLNSESTSTNIKYFPIEFNINDMIEDAKYGKYDYVSIENIYTVYSFSKLTIRLHEYRV